MNTTIDQLARRANDAFKNTAGFVSCQARSTTALEFHFTNATDAERFKLEQEVQTSSGQWAIDANNPATVVNERSASESAQAAPPPITPIAPVSPPPAASPPTLAAPATPVKKGIPKIGKRGWAGVIIFVIAAYSFLTARSKAEKDFVDYAVMDQHSTYLLEVDAEKAGYANGTDFMTHENRKNGVTGMVVGCSAVLWGAFVKNKKKV